MNHQEEQINILLVHTGKAAAPEYLLDNISLTVRIAPKSRVLVLLNEPSFSKLKIQVSKHLVPWPANLELICIDDIPSSKASVHYEKTSSLDREFRGGFWFSTSNRFFVIADFMEARKLNNCLHIENDVVLYIDPTDLLPTFKDFADFAVPLDRIRAIPGVVWLKTPEVSRLLASAISKSEGRSDMMTLAEFCTSNPNFAKPLPTIPVEYAKKNGLNTDRFCQGIKEFEGVFDAAAIGQYLGGIHWMNEPSKTHFFVNESSDLYLSDYRFFWAQEGDHRIPYIEYEGQYTRVLATHVHSKNILGFSPFNHGTTQDVNNIITGEKIQALADLTISSAEVTEFHGRDNIQTPKVLEIPEKIKKRLFSSTKKIVAPEIDFLETCREAKIIFTYTHLLDYFKNYIAPRLNESFVLITHNSDNGVTDIDLELLNHPKLLSWYAQNVEFNHSKLKALPIGMANRQWGADRIQLLYKASKNNRKTKTLYANFNQKTHPKRANILKTLEGLPGLTKDERKDFNGYIQDLAAHQFCLCPRGNGVDTHRFWEAQYVSCIPIILREDWTPAYSNLPILVIEKWEDLKSLNLQNEYIKISTTNYDRSTLNLNVLAEELNTFKRTTQ